jgi:hypothetical protein
MVDDYEKIKHIKMLLGDNHYNRDRSRSLKDNSATYLIFIGSLVLLVLLYDNKTMLPIGESRTRHLVRTCSKCAGRFAFYVQNSKSSLSI